MPVSGCSKRKEVGSKEDWSKDKREGKIMESRLVSLCQVLVLSKS